MAGVGPESDEGGLLVTDPGVWGGAQELTGADFYGTRFIALRPGDLFSVVVFASTAQLADRTLQLRGSARHLTVTAGSACWHICVKKRASLGLSRDRGCGAGRDRQVKAVTSPPGCHAPEMHQSEERGLSELARQRGRADGTTGRAK
jgi:hypothetical protein